MSQQIFYDDYDAFHQDVNFSAAAYFTHYFAKILLSKQMPDDVDVLNVVVPDGATEQTPWKVTRLARIRYFKPYVVREGKLDGKGYITSNVLNDNEIPPDNDIYTVRVEKMVAVTPLSLDMTSRVAPNYLEALLKEK